MAPIILFVKSKFFFFPLGSPLPAQLTADISKGPLFVALCLLHKLLRGSQKLKPEGVNRLLRFVTHWKHLKGEGDVCTCSCGMRRLACTCVKLSIIHVSVQ